MFYTLLQASSWAIFIGRFHPALVHFPIGFLLIGALLEIGRRTGKINVSESSIRFILLISAIGATVACICGYLLSLGGGYDAKLLNNHMWQGIGVAVFAWIAWLIKTDGFGGKVPFAAVIYLPAFLLATVLTLTAGHDGGSLTHGQGYLTQYTPEPFRGMAGMPPLEEKAEEIKPIADVQNAVVYNDIVQPILQARCAQCHNANKQKGDLRVDQLALLMKGGKAGPALIPGKGSESDMIKRCLLDEGDDDHMPPKGKPQLTTDQITLISWWIDQGAPADKKVSELKANEAVTPALASLSEGAGPGGAKSGNPPKQVSALAGMKVEAASEQAIAALRKAGLIVNTISQDQNLLEVSAVNAPNFDDKQVDLLKPVSQQIAWLKLGDTKITDAALEQIGKFPNLNKLHLEHTIISDKGLNALKGLKFLEYLNIVDTKVGNDGLKELATIKGLRSVYVWQSAVTDSAVAQVGRKNPNLMIVNGFNEAAVAEFLKAGDTNTTAPKGETKKL